MGFLEINRKVLEHINFKTRYDELSKKYHNNNIIYDYDIDEITKFISTHGYKVHYYKSEHFFKINIGKTCQNYDSYCHIKVSKNSTILVPAIYILNGKEYITGNVFTILYKQVAQLSADYIVDKLYFHDENSIKQLIEACLQISEDFKDNIIIN